MTKRMVYNYRMCFFLLMIVVLCQSCNVTPSDNHQFTVHRIKSSKNSFYSNSHIIEGENGLIAIDVHMHEDDVKALTKRIKELKKPLEAIVISHRHADHMNGLEFISSDFPETPILSGPKTIDAVELNASSWGISADRVKTITEGKINLVGREFEVAFFDDSESPESVVLYDTKTKSLFTGDLVLHGQHLWLVEQQLDNWLFNLEKLKERFEIDTVYPGHGVKGGIELLGYTEDYIHYFREVLSMGLPYDDAKRKMNERFPEHEFETALEFSLGTYGLLPH